jgi:fucose permease
MLPARPGFVVNLCNVCYGVGAAAGPLVVSARLAAGGEGRTVLFGGAAALVLLVPAAYAVLPSRVGRPGLARGGARVAPSPPGLPSMVPLLLVFFLYGGIETGFSGWLATYAERSLSLSGAQAALLTSQYWACYLGGRGIATLLSLRIRPDALLAWTLAGLVAGGVALVGTVGRPGWTAVAVAAIGLATGPIYPQAFAVVAGGRAEGAARAAALAGTLGSLGAIGLPWAMGVILDHAGARPLALTMPLMAVVMLMALVIGRRAGVRACPASVEGR